MTHYLLPWRSEPTTIADMPKHAAHKRKGEKKGGSSHSDLPKVLRDMKVGDGRWFYAENLVYVSRRIGSTTSNCSMPKGAVFAQRMERENGRVGVWRVV